MWLETRCLELRQEVVSSSYILETCLGTWHFIRYLVRHEYVSRDITKSLTNRFSFKNFSTFYFFPFFFIFLLFPVQNESQSFFYLFNLKIKWKRIAAGREGSFFHRNFEFLNIVKNCWSILTLILNLIRLVRWVLLIYT